MPHNSLQPDNLFVSDYRVRVKDKELSCCGIKCTQLMHHFLTMWQLRLAAEIVNHETCYKRTMRMMTTLPLQLTLLLMCFFLTKLIVSREFLLMCKNILQENSSRKQILECQAGGELAQILDEKVRRNV